MYLVNKRKKDIVAPCDNLLTRQKATYMYPVKLMLTAMMAPRQANDLLHKML